jgi:NhaP-type Na+/H+ or K+/H+ antiporter
MTWTLAVIAALLVSYAAASGRLRRINVSAPMFFTLTGLLAGPVLGWIDLGVGSEQVKLIAEITLTLVLFADASRISIPALRHEHTVPLRLLAIALPLTVVAGVGVGVAVLPGVSLAEALVLATMLASTDAALGQAVVTDQRIPSRIRQGLNVESGLNDGLCVPLFLIAIAIAEGQEGAVTGSHALHLVLEEIGFGAAAGVAAGALGGLALLWAARHRAIDAGWKQLLAAATALLSAGLALPLGGSIFIAAFVAGFTFGWLHREPEGTATYLVDEGGELANAVTFIVFGAVILGPALSEMTWQLALYAVLSLTVVRMLPVAVSLIGTGARPATVLFLGWFGPRGLASIVFAVMSLDEGELNSERTLLLAVVATVGLSVIAHGLSAGPGATRYADWFAGHPDQAQPAMESVPAAAHRWRTGPALRPEPPPDVKGSS